MAVKRNRFVQLAGGTRTVNRALEAKARSLAGLKGYVTNLQACPDGTAVTAEFVIGACHRLVDQKFVRTARRYRTIEIRAGAHTITAAGPPPDDLRDVLGRIHGESGAH